MTANIATDTIPAFLETMPAWERLASQGLPYVFAVALAVAVLSIWSIATHGRN